MIQPQTVGSPDSWLMTYRMAFSHAAAYQPQVRLPPRLALEVQRNAFFVPVQRGKVVADTVYKRKVLPAQITIFDLLNLDDFSTQIREDLCGISAQQIAGMIQYLQIG